MTTRTKTYRTSAGDGFTVTETTEGGYRWRMVAAPPVAGAFFGSATMAPEVHDGSSRIAVTLYTTDGRANRTSMYHDVASALAGTAQVLRRVPGDPADHRDAMRAWMRT